MNESITKELPENWELTTLGNVTQPIEKVKPANEPAKEILYLDIGGIDKATNLVVNYKKYLGKDAPSRAQQAIKKGDIAFASVRPYLRNIAIVPNNLDDQVGSTGFCFLRPAKGVSNKYIYYWVLSNAFINDITKYQKGSSYPAVTNKQILERNIPLAPPEQQKRIVAKIEELFSHIDTGIEALKKAKQLLKQYRQSVLKAAVTGELTKDWREANKDKLEPSAKLLERILKERRQKWEEQQLEKFKVTGKIPKNNKWKEKYKEPADLNDWDFLCELPETWVWSSVAQIGDSNDQAVLTGPFGSNLGKKDFISSGVPVLTIGCLKEAGVVLTKAMHVSDKKASELQRYKLKDGDMLFSRMAAVGRVGYVGKELEGCLFNYHIMRLRLHDEAILQKYFVHYVRGSRQVYEYVKEVNHGATRDGINTQQLLEIPVALPPLDEQHKICHVVKEKLDLIRRLESDVDLQLNKARKNKQSILASAFNGALKFNK